MNGDESKSPPSDQPKGSSGPPPSDTDKSRKKRRLRTTLIVIGAIVVVFFIIPKAFHTWHTVPTDDNRVKKGDVLVELDPTHADIINADLLAFLKT